MFYILPKSYVMLVQYSKQQIGYIVVIDDAVHDHGFLKAENYIDAHQEVKPILKRTKKYKKLPVYRDLTKEYVGLFQLLFL